MRNRFLLWFSTSFFAAAAIPAISPSAIFNVITVVLLVIIVAFLLSKAELRRCAVIVVGAAVLSITWQMIYFELTSVPVDLLGGDVEIIAEVTSYSERNGEDTGIYVNAKLEGIERGRGQTLSSILYINDVDYELSPGDIIHATARIKQPENTRFFAGKTYYKSRNIDVLAYTSHIDDIEKSEKLKFKYIPQYLAKCVRNKVDEIYSYECAVFLRSLILGDRDGLSASFHRALEVTGLVHTISVSGMHIAFLIGIIILFTKNKYLRLISIPIIFLFVFMVGAPQSALRAVIMQMLLLLSAILKREYDMLTSLSASALILVALNPYCASDIGFLLSFSATLGIIILAPRISGAIKSITSSSNRFIKKIIAYFAPVVATSIAASLFTAPILAVSFGNISLIAPISNVLLGVLITAEFVLGIITTVLGFISIPVAKVGSFVVSGIYEIINFGIRGLSEIPFAEIYVGSRIFIALILFLCFVAVFAIAFGRKKVRLRVVSLVAAISLLAAGVAFALSKPDKMGDGVRFDILDVGQGQCIVAESRDMCVMIDCGGSGSAGNIAKEHIRNRGIDKIDALILTHAHSDHASDAEYILESVPTEIIYAPAADKEEAVFSDIAQSAEDLGTEIEFVEQNVNLSFCDASVKLLTLPPENSQNENGLVVIISDGDFDMIITGDIPNSAERILAEENELPDCEAYVVGHHGSGTSSSMPFLNEILPEVSIISVGAGNPYNHPAKGTLTRLSKLQSSIYRTDTQGSITLYSR